MPPTMLFGWNAKLTFSSEENMKRLVWFVVFGLCLSWFGLRVANARPEKEIEAVLVIPTGLAAVPGDTLMVPVFITTFQPLVAAKLTIEFDNKDFKFLNAITGPDGAGYAIDFQVSLPGKIIAAGANDNVAINVSSAGFNFLYGNDLNVLFLAFKVVGTAGGASPFAFNPDTTETELTTNVATKLNGGSLEFVNGNGTITSVAALSIPGGFSIAKAETLVVPVRLSSVKRIGLAQIALEYDNSDLKFLGAQTGVDATGFSIFVETAPGFTATAPGVNQNVLITLYSGAAAIIGSDKTVATLSFQALGEVGGNSPLAFDRRLQHTVLSTTDLVDLTGADLTFRNGDATILPPLVKLSGNVVYRNTNTRVSGAVITVSGVSATTNTNGVYLSRRVSQSTYTLRASKTGDLRGAIQASDALMILRATSFVDSLQSEQSLAADVTRDGHVTVSDALAVLRFLAGQTTGIGHVGEWIFQPEFYTLFVQSDTTRNFNTFLLGEVNGNWAPSGSLEKAAALPVATIALGEWREDGDNLYLALQAGKEGRVFTALASLALPADLGKAVRFVPSRPEVVAVTNEVTKQDWRLALISVAGFAPEEKIGELVVPRIVANGRRNWQLKSAEVNDWPQKVTVPDDDQTLPTEYVLSQNYPNPFNPTTWITFGIPARVGEVAVRLDIFTIDGRLVRSLVDNKLSPGTHRVQWDSRDNLGAAVPTGIYFYRIRAGEFTASRKLALVK